MPEWLWLQFHEISTTQKVRSYSELYFIILDLYTDNYSAGVSGEMGHLEVR